MKIKAFLKLIRIRNILMIGLTQLLIRYAIIAPILSVFSMELRLPLIAFLAYVLATMLIAAAGYALNDYYDRDLDLINRDQKDIVVGTTLDPGWVMQLYRIFNVAALVLAVFACYKSGVWIISICFMVIIGLLYFYTTTYKKQFLTGNLIVALVTAMVPFMVYLIEIPPVISHYKLYMISAHFQLKVIAMWVLSFSVFAFFSAFTREIIKDMEDYEGDKIVGRNTLPVVLGMKASLYISVGILMLIIGGLVFSYFVFFINGGSPDFITMGYFLAFLIVPISYNIYHLFRAKEVSDYKFCGDLLKIIMLLGVLYAAVVWYIIHKTFGV